MEFPKNFMVWMVSSVPNIKNCACINIPFLLQQVQCILHHILGHGHLAGLQLQDLLKCILIKVNFFEGIFLPRGFSLLQSEHPLLQSEHPLLQSEHPLLQSEHPLFLYFPELISKYFLFKLNLFKHNSY